MRHILKFGVAAVLVGFISCGNVLPASAKTPPEVMTPYKAYNAAIKVEDFKRAEKKAYEAWRAAEDALGDNKITAVLAHNYASVASHNGQKKDVKKAYLRAIKLSPFEDDGGIELRLQREVALTEWQLKNGRKDVTRRLKAAAKFANENGAENSTFLGEIYTLLAQRNIETFRYEKVENYAEMALEIFENRTDGIASYHPYLARLYSGYGKEGQEALIPAVMEYQDVMKNVESQLPKDHPFLSRALGRWLNMRYRIVREGKLKEAEAAGMCQCWPYDKPRNEAIHPIKRVPPIMPRKAWQSGFSLVEFDLDDAGNVINPRLLESWPEEVFDKSSIKAVKQWKYSPRTGEEINGDRTDIVTTIRYILRGPSGQVIE